MLLVWAPCQTTWTSHGQTMSSYLVSVPLQGDHGLLISSGPPISLACRGVKNTGLFYLEKTVRSCFKLLICISEHVSRIATSTSSRLTRRWMRMLRNEERFEHFITAFRFNPCVGSGTGARYLFPLFSFLQPLNYDLPLSLPLYLSFTPFLLLGS